MAAQAPLASRGAAGLAGDVAVEEAMSEVDYRVVPAQLTGQQEIPLSAISPTLRLMLKRLEETEPTRIVVVDGLEVQDNVQGLAELLYINNSVSDWCVSGSGSVGAVLDAWDRQDQRASCARLWQLLVSLGRYDLLRDIRSRLLTDARIYLDRLRREGPPAPPPAPAAVDSRRFDVYASYCEASHEDAAKAAEIVKCLRDNGLEVFSAEDRLAGVFSQEEFHQITSRCTRVMVLWSRAYQSEEELRFELNHVRSTDPAAVRRRMIPVLLDETPLPGYLAGIVAVRFGQRACMQKLLRSLRDGSGAQVA